MRDVEAAEVELKVTMMKGTEYDDFRNRRDGPEAIKGYNVKKGSIFRRLDRSSPAYRKAGEKREKTLFNSNIETLEYMTNDYEEKGWVIQTDWMQTCGHSH